MLIENNKLNIEEFKAFFDSINWKRVPRNLGQDHSEYFYIGSYEDDDKIVQVTIRPSKIMAVSETFKRRMISDGSIPPEGFKGQVVNWGSSVEVRVDDKFLEAVVKAAKPLPPRENQVLTWE